MMGHSQFRHLRVLPRYPYYINNFSRKLYPRHHSRDHLQNKKQQDFAAKTKQDSKTFFVQQFKYRVVRVLFNVVLVQVVNCNYY